MTDFGSVKLITTGSSLTIKEAKYGQGMQVLSEVEHKEEVELNTSSSVIGKDRRVINMGDYVSFELDGEVSANYTSPG